MSEQQFVNEQTVSERGTEALVAEIREVFSQNGIAVDPEFKNLVARGYGSDDCQRLSDEIVRDLARFAACIVNNVRPNAKVRDGIDDLVRLVLRLSDRKAAEELPKLRQKYAAVLARVEPALKEKEADGVFDRLRRGRRSYDLDARDEALRYLDSSLRGADIVLSMELSDTVRRNLEESVRILKLIRAEVAAVWDHATRNAVNYAKEIIDRVAVWRNAVGVYLCTLTEVDALNAALAAAKEWRTLRSAPRTAADMADDEYIASTIVFAADNLRGVEDGLKKWQSVEVFIDRLAAFEAVTAQQCAVDGLLEEKKELAAKKSDLSAQKAAWIARYRNGEAGATDADAACRQIEAEEARVDSGIVKLDDEIAARAAERDERDGVAEEFHRLSDAILRYKNDPWMVGFLAGDLSFVNLCEVMMGRAVPQDVRGTVDQILAALDKEEQQRSLFRAVIQEGEGARRLVEELRKRREPRKTAAKTDPAQRERDRLEREERARLDMEARIRGMEGEPRPQKTEEPDAAIPLSDSDK